MNRFWSFALGGLLVMGHAGAAEYHVAPDGDNAGDGSAARPWAAVARAQDVLEPGDTLILAPGRYTGAWTLSGLRGAPDAPITIAAAKHGRVWFDLARAESGLAFTDCAYVNLVGVEVAGMHTPGTGITLENCSHSTVQACVVHDMQGLGIRLSRGDRNILRGNVAYHNDSGIYVGQGSTQNVVTENICAFGNKSSENADGIGSSDCEHNHYRYNVFYGNNDDGLDMWTSTGSVIEYNIATRNGDGKDGDGNGFKLGGHWKDDRPTSEVWTGGQHTVRHNLSFDNNSTGFTNNGSDANTYEGNVAYENANTSGYASVPHMDPANAQPILAEVQAKFRELVEVRLLRLDHHPFPPEFEPVFELAGIERAKVSAADLPNWTLVVAEDAIPSELYAAEELAGLIEAAFGAAPAIANTPANPEKNILVGARAAALAGKKANTADLGDEGLRITIEPACIVIAGGEPRGTLYGVYTFAERYLGIRFLTHDHTHIPAASNISPIPCETYAHVPPFSFRWSYYHENSAYPAFAAKLRVNTTTNDEKLGGVAPQSLINHSFHRYLPPGKYGEEHPEYFALVGGVRKLDVGGGGPEPCVTNPDVIRIITEGVLEDLRANPNRRNISVSQNDNDEYCRCERCQAINEREGTPMGANLHLVNKVAEAVQKEFPDVKVGTLAYWYTRKPPRHMKPRDNVQIQLCSIECCTTFPLDDPRVEKNRAFIDDFRGWSAICDDIWVWDYNTNFASYDLPFPNLRTITPNVRFFLRNHVHGAFMQANGNGNAGEFSDLRNYVMARCLWNPALEGWALLEEFCRLHYREAAEPVIAYQQWIHDVAQSCGRYPNCFGLPEEFGLNREVAIQAMAYFDRALARAQSQTVKDRVEKASICACRAMIEAGTALKLEDGRARLRFPEGYENTPGRYKELAAKHNMTRAAERTPIGEFLAELDAAVEGVPALRIENELWRLTLLPGNGAQLVEMCYKPEGRHLLRAWERAGMRRAGGAFQEIGEQGLDTGGHYEVQVQENALHLRKLQGDGSVYARSITLEADRVRFESVIEHKGETPKTYYVKVHPEFDVVSTTADADIISAYVRDGEKWIHFNQDWEHLEGPNHAVLKTAGGGAMAFFNHEAGFGLLQTYAPEQFEQPRLWWEHSRHQMNLELMTQKKTLAEGERYAYAYTCAYLEQPPAPVE